MNNYFHFVTFAVLLVVNIGIMIVITTFIGNL